MINRREKRLLLIGVSADSQRERRRSQSRRGNFVRLAEIANRRVIERKNFRERGERNFFVIAVGQGQRFHVKTAESFFVPIFCPRKTFGRTCFGFVVGGVERIIIFRRKFVGGVGVNFRHVSKKNIGCRVIERNVMRRPEQIFRALGLHQIKSEQPPADFMLRESIYFQLRLRQRRKFFRHCKSSFSN